MAENGECISHFIKNLQVTGELRSWEAVLNLGHGWIKFGVNMGCFKLPGSKGVYLAVREPVSSWPMVTVVLKLARLSLGVETVICIQIGEKYIV
jgi:hypothetical protein